MKYDLFSMLPEKAFCKGFGKNAPATLEGGGGWSPVSWVGDAFSSAGNALASIDPSRGFGNALASIDPSRSLGNALASIDPSSSLGNSVASIDPFLNFGKNYSSSFVLGDALASIDPSSAIGSGLAQVDQAVNDLPGGWALPAVVAASVAAPYLAPELATAVGTGEAGTIATEAGQNAFFDALASGATSAEAVDAGLAADAAILDTSAIASGGVGGGGTFVPVADSSFATMPLGEAGTTGAELAGGSITAPSSYVSPSQALTADVSGATTGSGTGMTFGSTGATDGLVAPTGSAIAVDPAILAGTGAELPVAETTATGAAMGAGTSGVGSLSPALPAAGATETGTMSASLAPNTVLGTGADAGGAIGASYQLGANGLPATDALGNAISGSSVGLNGSTATPTTLTTNDLNNAKKLAQALTSSSGSQLTNAAQNLATGQTGVGMAIPALLRGNQTPFVQTAQQPIRNTSPDLASLANLLKQGQSWQT